MEEKHYSAKEFAQALGISKNYLLKLEAEKKIPAARRCARGKIQHRYYTVEDIISYRAKLKMPPLLDKRRVQLFLNFKGGTGKSTISASYAYAVAELGVHVLAIDLDAQQHMTKCLGFEESNKEPSIYEVLIENKNINEVIKPSKMPTLDIIPASLKLSVIESRVPNQEMKEFMLAAAFSQLQLKDYKLIVMDSHPNITFLNKSAILAADDLLVPVLPDYLSFDGLSLLMEELARMEKAYMMYGNIYQSQQNRILDKIRIFINQYRNNEVLCKASKKNLEQYYPQYLCSTCIPYNSKISRSSAAGMPIFQYDRSCPGAKQIRNLVGEILGLCPFLNTSRMRKSSEIASV